MLSAYPLIGFLTQSSQYQIWKANTYSILANGNRTWTASVAVIHWNLKSNDPTYSEHKSHKRKIENWLSIGFQLESYWLVMVTYIHNHFTMFNLQYDGES